MPLVTDSTLTVLEKKIGADVEDKSLPSEADTSEAEITRLAQLSVIEYEKERKEAGKLIGIERLSILDKLVKTRKQELAAQSSGDELTDGIEPWESAVDGNALANEIIKTIERYSILPKGGAIALVLWAIATYCINCFRIFPKLLINSPEKRCGKTTTMEVLCALVCRALMSSNLSPAVIFRAIEAWGVSLLIDEGDTFIANNEELRGIVNSGHTRSSAFVLRVEGDSSNLAPKRFSTWSPMCIGMIKAPPDTIKDRSITVTLRRKLPGENVERLPLELNEQCLTLRRKALRWSIDNTDALKRSDPQVPVVGNDRAEDNWRPLLAIADLIGGEWPEKARNAMRVLESIDSTDDGIGPMILADIRSIFKDKNVARFHSQDLVDHLIALDDRPWCEWRHGKPITKNSLAKLLKPFGIRSKDVRINTVKKGYETADFEDAFSRYLSAPLVQSATTLQPSNDGASSQIENATKGKGVAFQKPLQPTDDAACSVVALQEGGTEKQEEMEVFTV